MRVTKTELKRLIKEELEAVLKEKVGDDLDSDLQHAEHWYEHWKNIHNNTSDKNGQMWDDSRMQMQHYLAQITNIKAAKKAAAAKKKAAAKEAMKARRQDALSTMDTPQEAMEYWCGKDCPPDTPVPEDWKERTKAALLKQFSGGDWKEGKVEEGDIEVDWMPEPNDWVGYGYREVASAVKNITGLKSLKGGWWRKPLPEGKCNDPEFCYTEGRRAGRMKRNHPVRVAFRKYYNARKGKKRKPKKEGPMKFYTKGNQASAGAIEAIKKGEEAVLVVDDNQKEVSRIKDIDEAIGIVMGNINASDDKGDRKASRAARKELRRLKVTKRALAKKANKKAGLGDLYKRAGKRKRVPSSQLTKKQQNLQTKAK